MSCSRLCGLGGEKEDQIEYELSFFVWVSFWEQTGSNEKCDLGKAVTWRFIKNLYLLRTSDIYDF